MTEFSRRRLLAAGTAGLALGVGGAASGAVGTAGAQESPSLEKWAQPMPVPDVREPDGQRDGVDYHELTMSEFEQQLHPDLPATTVWGFDGSYPGPTIQVSRGEPVQLAFDNSGMPDSHLLTVDDDVGGTDPGDYPHYDGEVPEVRNSVHVHGANVPPAEDGQSTSWQSPGGVEGPGRVTDVRTVPNDQARGTLLYHPHSLGITRLNVYAGLAGFYQVRSEAENELALPEGEYDVPLLLQDRAFDDDGSLSYPEFWQGEVSGDTAVVNGAVWPYVEVEPRRYRFRIANASNGRSFALSLRNETGDDVPTIHQIAPGHEFLEEVVPIGPDGAVESLALTPFERAEVVVDFSGFAGETLTLTNAAEFPYRGENSGSDLGELVQFRVAESTDGDPSADPAELSLPEPTRYDAEEAQVTRSHTLGMDDEFRHVLNGQGMLDEGGTVRPELGSTEVWEFENTTGVAHPMHLHQVTFRVLGRGPDGTEPPDPTEEGPKDVVRVEPDETVRIATEFGDYTGPYPWHCHMLEHEDNAMMLMFDVVHGELHEYADDDGVVTGSGLEAATDDWAAGDLDSAVLADAFTRWHTGEPVVDDEEAGSVEVAMAGTEVVESARSVDVDETADGQRATVTVEADADAATAFTLVEEFEPAAESVTVVEADGADVTAVREDDGALVAAFDDRSSATLVYEVVLADSAAVATVEGSTRTATSKGSVEAPTLGDDQLLGGDGDCADAAASEAVEGQTVCDLNDDGLFRDVNGDGEVAQDDVVHFFENQHRDAWKRSDLFDFSGSDSVGHGDVIALFEYVSL